MNDLIKEFAYSALLVITIKLKLPPAYKVYVPLLALML